jgi:hypothetical protein
MQGVSLQGSIAGINANPILTHVNAYISVSVTSRLLFLSLKLVLAGFGLLKRD